MENLLQESLATGKKLSIEEGKDNSDKAEGDDKNTATDEAECEGLETCLRPVKKMKRAPKGSEDLERFLHRLETTLLEK
eukprot:12463214-Ditylum_brightwellii.AAC.1